jgi:hypothetical protein
VRRGPLIWILAAAGVLLVIVAAALIGGRDKSGEAVTADDWAQSVCGAVGVWRGEVEAIVEDIRTPAAFNMAAGEEPQSETPQGRTGLLRKGLERVVQATETMVEGIDNAGVPDTPQGETAASQVSEWADSALDELEEADEALDEEADSLEESLEQLGAVAQAMRSVLAGGVQTIAELGRVDPQLTATLRASSTCREIGEETRA